MSNVTFPAGSVPFITTDDSEALDLILRLGLLPQVTPEKRLSEGSGRALYYVFHGHPTHWVLVCRFWGFTKKSDNGYMLKAWPKRHFPASVMDSDLAAFASQPHFQSSANLPRADAGKN